MFDLLWLDGDDLTGSTYLERRKLLAETVQPDSAENRRVSALLVAECQDGDIVGPQRLG